MYRYIYINVYVYRDIYVHMNVCGALYGAPLELVSHFSSQKASPIAHLIYSALYGNHFELLRCRL